MFSRIMSDHSREDWLPHLATVVTAINSVPKPGMTASPTFLMFGDEPTSIRVAL
jgi:hypothetical protein